jgi:hypothetical protein
MEAPAGRRRIHRATGVWRIACLDLTTGYPYINRMEGEEFEWDDGKAETNLRLHGISFEDALPVFLDPWRLEVEDDREDYGEPRYYSIGMVDDVVLAVIYTWRGECARIISARKATRAEQRKYDTNRTEPS